MIEKNVKQEGEKEGNKLKKINKTKRKKERGKKKKKSTNTNR